MRVRILAAIIALASAPAASSGPSHRPQAFVDLAYPPPALAARQTGAVILRVETDATGRVVNAEPLSGPETLRSSAVHNAKRWTLSAGARTDVLVYRFEIDDGLCNDDRRSLFRLIYPNVAVITACSSRPGAIIDDPGGLVPISTSESPAYPIIARNGQITGAVVLELSIAADGSVVSVRPLNDLQFFARVAVAHAQSWRVETTVAKRAFVVYEFALDNRDCSVSTNTTFWRVTAGVFRLSACRPPGQED